MKHSKRTNFFFLLIVVAAFIGILMASTSSSVRQPPAYILQSWHREQCHLNDHDLLHRTFVIAPDGTLPLSRLRHRFRMIYEERSKPRIVIHRDPWDLPNGNFLGRTELVNSYTTC